MQVKDYDSERIIAYETDMDERRSSFSVLYETHFQRLFEYGCRLHTDQHLVQDCIQDTFIKLWNIRSRIPEINNIKSYLFISLKNNILNKIASGRTNITQAGENMFELSYSIEDEIIKKEISGKKLADLYTALNALTARQKECLYLRYFEGLSYEEIAELLGISTKATYKLNARALDYLKANISPALFVLLFFRG